ncbi:MAG TPA: phospholipase D-like domain-containing protein, partial [Sphingomonas sp.]|nr:phospholipase D-like domain-containing protein [Sphingomonas sp.]
AFRDDLRHGKRLDMIAAYFAPNPGAVRRLGRLARSGHARIITASKSDNTVTIAAARHCYLRLLRRRAEIFEYRPTKLHTKLYAIDDVSYVGSANFDIRSLYINIEVMLRIEDVALADRIRAQFDEEAAQSRPIDIPLIRARAGRWRRFKWRIAYFIVAVMDFSVTRRINFGGVGRELD